MSTIKVAISQDFMLAFAGIPQKAQKKVMEFVTKFRQDPQSTGINYEKFHIAKDPRYRSVRIDQNYRGIVLKPEQGNVYLLLWVDKHDDAYDWASRHRCEVNPETGILEVFESNHHEDSVDAEPAQPRTDAVVKQVPDQVTDQNPDQDPVAAASPLFFLTDKQLLAIGVPAEHLTTVKGIQSETQLEQVESSLPPSAFEALYLLAAGTPWDEIEADYSAQGKAQIDTPIDTGDLETALAHPGSQRFFHVVEDELELKEMLEAPLEHWRVFLHPSQRKLVERHWNGPVRVLGGAGTGKTVVAMHRAKWLVNHVLEQEHQRVLFTTFTANLATDIENNLRKICSAEQLARIEIKHIDRWVSEFLRKNRYPHDIVYLDRDKNYAALWQLAMQLAPSELGLPESFYREEWERVLLPQRVMTRAEYFQASRKGRGVALNRKQRADLWPVFEELRTQMQQKGLRAFEDATLDAADILRHQAVSQPDRSAPYRSIIVDEAQDMGPEALTLIRSLLAEQADDIFIVGDGHQRIYRRKASMGNCGIKILGRSRKLRINYRTTEETRRFATSVLENIAVDDLDGGEDSISGYRSLMHGEDPRILPFASLSDEISGVAAKIRQLIDAGEAMQNICVTARTKRLRDQFAQQLQQHGLDTWVLEQQNDNRNTPGIRLATMHRVKGLEFRYVFIVGVNEGVIPLNAATSGTEDPVEARQRDLNERALLHVAATRAIKGLFISYAGSPSPYLQKAQHGS